MPSAPLGSGVMPQVAMPTEFFVEALEPEIRWRHLWQGSYEARGRKYGLHVCRIVDGGSLGNRSGGSNSSSSGFSQGTSIALPAGGSGEPQWPLDLCHDRMASSDRSMRRRQDSHQVTHCFTFRGEPWKWQVTNSAWQPRWLRQVSRTSGFTICAIPGHRGIARRERRAMNSKTWEAGSRGRWWIGMPSTGQSIWQWLPLGSSGFVLGTWEMCSRSCHVRNKKRTAPYS